MLVTVGFYGAMSMARKIATPALAQPTVWCTAIVAGVGCYNK